MPMVLSSFSTQVVVVGGKLDSTLVRSRKEGVETNLKEFVLGMGENFASSHLAQGWQGTCSLIGSFEKDWKFYPYSFPRSPTAMDERVVKIPSHKIPTWKP